MCASQEKRKTRMFFRSACVQDDTCRLVNSGRNNESLDVIESGVSVCVIVHVVAGRFQYTARIFRAIIQQLTSIAPALSSRKSIITLTVVKSVVAHAI